MHRAMSIIRKIAVKIGLSERRRDARVHPRGIDAFYWTGTKEERVKIKNISPTGVFLLAGQPWSPGTSVLLTLQSQGWIDGNFKQRIRLRASVVWADKDGAALTFVPQYIDTLGWLDLMSKAVTLTPQNDAVQVFRMAKALAFLMRISPSAAGEISQLITKELSDERSATALEVMLQADEILVSKGYTPRTGVSAPLIRRILEAGSKTSEELMRQSWAGLLASSCLVGSEDSISLTFVDLLFMLRPLHVRILMAGGQRAIESGWMPGTSLSQAFHCTMGEMKKIAENGKMAGIEWALNDLHDFGLLELTVKPLGFAPLDHANLTLTNTGLELYTRCSGQLPPHQDEIAPAKTAF